MVLSLVIGVILLLLGRVWLDVGVEELLGLLLVVGVGMLLLGMVLDMVLPAI